MSTRSAMILGWSVFSGLLSIGPHILSGNEISILARPIHEAFTSTTSVSGKFVTSFDTFGLFVKYAALGFGIWLAGCFLCVIFAALFDRIGVSSESLMSRPD